MKKLILSVVLIQSAICNAGSGMPCEKIEYAQLKNSTKEELKYEYCLAHDRIKLNGELYAIGRKLIDSGSSTNESQRETTEIGEAGLSCRRAAIAALGMLEKKFKTKSQSCR